jgi:hypothetical protein
MRESVLREVLKQQPFQAFRLTTADGREFPVSHPDFLLIDRGSAAHYDPTMKRKTILDPLLIVSVDPWDR